MTDDLGVQAGNKVVEESENGEDEKGVTHTA